MTGGLPDSRRARQAWLANLRQELLAPASAILGYAEILHEEAKNGGAEVLADVERILSSAQGLYAQVDRLLDQELAESLFESDEEKEAEKRLRHDLRTPINAVKGYSEMLLEDIDDLGITELRGDFESLLGEANHLLTQLDRIVDFSRSGHGGIPDADADTGKAATMFAELVASIQPVGNAAAGPKETGRILVVDDLETNRELLARRLEREGHEVVTASGGREALAVLENETVDLVLLDLMMPDTNGFEVLTRMKSDSRLYRVPVIMISALDEMDSVIRCIEAGAEDYLPKPFNPVLLNARINACLEKRQWRERERLYLARLEDEKEKYEKLLLNILPRQIIGRLHGGETIIADRVDDVSVLFSDLVGFTTVSAELAPARLVEYLNTLFSRFDALARELGVEKIKMIGDAYMAVAGLPEPRPDHAQVIARMALGMMEIVKRGNETMEIPFKARVGIHSGPVVAGIIGTHRFVYDVWGDTVNLASRLESLSQANRIHISRATAELIGRQFELEARGSIRVKGKGAVETYFLNARQSTAAPHARL